MKGRREFHRGTPTKARSLIEVSTFKGGERCVPCLLRHYLFIYATFNYDRETAKLIAPAAARANVPGIRDAICMQIFRRRDSARGRIRPVTNRDRMRGRGPDESGETALTRVTSSHLRPRFLSSPTSCHAVSFFIAANLPLFRP